MSHLSSNISDAKHDDELGFSSKRPAVWTMAFPDLVSNRELLL